ncbi:MAG: hypothetical protein L0H63_08020 [Nitrococcus sp.]|nr:hypothetical protein [Nitrococcus sp.]
MSEHSGLSPQRDRSDVPRGNLAGLIKYAKFDLVSGFLVFLIALPLSLSVALAYGYPPVVGVFTSIIGGLLATFISNAELAIKGPAAGLIVIAAGCVMDFGGDGIVGGFTAIDQAAYEAALAVGVAAGVLQILFGVWRAGALGSFFPSSVVHGMLAAIGVIIMIKMIPLTVGVSVKGTPTDLVLNAPAILSSLNVEIAAVGVVSLAIMFLWPLLKKVKAVKFLGAVPAPLVVLMVAIPMALTLQLDTAHTNPVTLTEEPSEELASVRASEEAETDSDALVKVPALGETFSALAFPDFSALTEMKAWKWVILFALIGTIESMLSAKAVDIMDPWKRKTNLDRDNVAIGVANTSCAFVGAPPMISVIVRSTANIHAGARTRFSNMYHGLYLLIFVALLPVVVGLIPIAALTAMLIYTGSRLASPRQFLHAYRIGTEQLVIFAATALAVIATNLLYGILIGIAVKLLIHIVNGVPIRSLFKPYVDAEKTDENTYTIRAKHSAVFSNWIALRYQIEMLGLQQNCHVTVDLSDTHLVDHDVMTRLHEIEQEFAQQGLRFEIVGLEDHRPFSEHPHAIRKRVSASRPDIPA